MSCLQKHLVTATALGGMVLWATTASSANLIPNGGFEDSTNTNTSPNWFTDHTTKSFFVQDAAVAAEGDWYLHHEKFTDQQTFMRFANDVVSIPANTDYVFKMKVRTPSTNSLVGNDNWLRLFLSWRNPADVNGGSLSFETIDIYKQLGGAQTADLLGGQEDVWVDIEVPITSPSQTSFFRPSFLWEGFPDNTLESVIFIDAVELDIPSLGGITGDFNASGQVEQGDLDLVLQNWGDDTAVTGIPAGWTNDNTNLGQIEQTELDRVLQNWGSTSAPDFAGSAVPEPATLALLSLGGLAMLRRR